MRKGMSWGMKLSEKKKERNAEIVARHKAGETMVSLAKEYALSTARISHLVTMAKWKERAKTDRGQGVIEQCLICKGPTLGRKFCSDACCVVYLQTELAALQSERDRLAKAVEVARDSLKFTHDWFEQVKDHIQHDVRVDVKNALAELDKIINAGEG